MLDRPSTARSLAPRFSTTKDGRSRGAEEDIRSPRSARSACPGAPAAPTTDDRRVITGLVPEAELLPTGTVPSFAELHDLDERFFPRGFVGTHRDERPEDLERAFWARPDNVAAMHLIAPYQEHFLKTGPMPT
jgi:hypothetical protein